MLEIEQIEPKREVSWTDRLHPETPWLERRKQELGAASAESKAGEGSGGLPRRAFCGGQTSLRGTHYFWFFTWLILGTAVAFLPYALLYRPGAYLQD